MHGPKGSTRTPRTTFHGYKTVAETQKLTDDMSLEDGGLRPGLGGEALACSQHRQSPCNPQNKTLATPEWSWKQASLGASR